MRKTIKVLILVCMMLTGCSSSNTPTQESVPTQPAANSEPTSMAEIVAQEAAVQRAVWQTLPLTNARTGETFTLADFADKTVLVEPMATWCVNCRAQLGNVTTAYNQLNGSDFVFVGISVGENISDADLASYADQQGFPMTFAIATPDMLTELVNSFGRTAITPPSTPHFIIRPDGSFTELFSGSKSADELISLMTAVNEA